jgi:hypothetical protein
MNFTDEEFVEEAFIHSLVKSKDPGDIKEFRYGHLSGIEAIKLYFVSRSKQIIPQSSRTPKRLITNVLENLEKFYYDGLSVDVLVKSKSNNLSEICCIYYAIMTADNLKSFLSFDGTHTLPIHERHNIDMNNPNFSTYEILFQNLKEERPRSRQQIFEFLKLKGIPISNLDNIIQYLSKKKII